MIATFARIHIKLIYYEFYTFHLQLDLEHAIAGAQKLNRFSHEVDDADANDSIVRECKCKRYCHSNKRCAVRTTHGRIKRKIEICFSFSILFEHRKTTKKEIRSRSSNANAEEKNQVRIHGHV